jgi:outer membrane protein assembly factor BamE (lipoprotein component of BamABCDE complex)
MTRASICTSVVFGGISLVLLTGCIVIPVDYYSRGSRHNLAEQTAASLQRNKTTKEEVLLLLGEPDYVSEDGQRFGYTWKKTKVIFVVAGQPAAGGGVFQRRYLLQLSFDASDRLSDVAITKEWETSP